MFGLSYRLSESFGGGLGFALGLTVAPVVFYPLLAFVRSQEMRRKRLNQMISSTVTAALVLGVVTCAPFVIEANAVENNDPYSATEELFGELSEGVYTLLDQTYQLTEDVALNGSLNIPSGTTATIDLNGHTLDRGLSNATGTAYADFITNYGTLTISDSSGNNSSMITGGYAENGGAVVNNGTLTISGGTFVNNRAYWEAGAVINNSGATLTANGGVFSCNSTVLYGGGLNLHLKQSTTFTDCTISFNETKEKDGGGFVMNASEKTLTLSNCKVDNNTADDCGGGIYIDAGTVNVSGGEINSNTSDDGGIYISGGDTLQLTNKAADIYFGV